MGGIAEAVEKSNSMNPIMGIGIPVVQEKPEVSRLINLIGEFQRIGRLGGIKQVALITRDGELVSEIPEKTCTGISAAMMAASLGAAETAFAEFHRGVPDMMVLFLNREKMIVKGAGPKMFLVVVIDNNISNNNILHKIDKTAKIIKSMS